MLFPMSVMNPHLKRSCTLVNTIGKKFYHLWGTPGRSEIIHGREMVTEFVFGSQIYSRVLPVVYWFVLDGRICWIQGIGLQPPIVISDSTLEYPFSCLKLFYRINATAVVKEIRNKLLVACSLFNIAMSNKIKSDATYNFVFNCRMLPGQVNSLCIQLEIQIRYIIWIQRIIIRYICIIFLSNVSLESISAFDPSHVFTKVKISTGFK